MRGVVFHIPVSFSNDLTLTVLHQSDFTESTFHCLADFSKLVFTGEAIFENTKFLEKSKFYSIELKCFADFKRAIFKGESEFQFCIAEPSTIRMSFINKDSLQHIRFTAIGVPLFSFLGCTWPNKLGLETHGTGVQDNLLACEELYRAMKQRAMNGHDMPMASHWHGREKGISLRLIQLKCTQHPKPRVVKWLEMSIPSKHLHAATQKIADLVRFLFCARLLRVTWWYKLSSGFGENPGQALRVLGCLVLVVLGIMWSVDLKNGAEDYKDISFWGRTLPALQHLLFITGPQASPKEPMWGSLLVFLTRLVIPVQAALFGFAMFNRFRR